MQNTTRS